jgi:hypothetical protein
MTDITTIAEIGTAVGTLFLGVATFASTRSANRSARIAERSLLLGLRPVLTPSRPDDPDQEIIFGDGRKFRIRAGNGLVEQDGGVTYLAIPLRNVGAGLAVLQRYDVITDNPIHEARRPGEHGLHDRQERRFGPIEDFRHQQRDLYIASGDIGYWQAALRDENDQLYRDLNARLEGTPEAISIDLLYGDHEGGQHAVSRFNLVPGDEGSWFCTVVFHWVLEAEDPREA